MESSHIEPGRTEKKMDTKVLLLCAKDPTRKQVVKTDWPHLKYLLGGPKKVQSEERA